MAHDSTHEPLNIPSFLLNPRMGENRGPNEDEVEAVMESVRRRAAAGGLIGSFTSADAAEDTAVDACENVVEDASVEDADVADVSAEETGVSEAPETLDTPAPPVEEKKQTSAPSGRNTAAFEPQAAPVAAPEPSTAPAPEPSTAPAPEPSAPEPPALEDDLAALNKLERRLFGHRYAVTELETFGNTIDPPKATADRAEALAVLYEEDRDLMADPAVGDMLERLSARAGELEPVVSKQVSVLVCDRHRIVAVPQDLASELVRLQAESYDVWLAAKAHNDWASFAPYLDRMVAMQRARALSIDPDADPYDTLLDEFEPGTNQAFYNNFFARVKQCVVPLLTSISQSGRTLSTDCVAGRFDEARQWELARDVARLEGIDEQANYITSTEHPFSAAMTHNFVVTAGHVVADDVMSNIFSMLHEVGHNLYEQGVDPAFARTSLKGGTSSGMHEAQSRFFENYVGRDRAFMVPLLALMKQRFPGQLSRVTANQLYRAVNRVAPSLIRTEADELTYPLHVLVRYEIEQLLLSGKADAAQVPQLWAERYRSYIGARVPDNTRGALQDMHWAQGLFGYFPSYALGNAYAAQLQAKMLAEGMPWDDLLRAGDLAPVRAWLRERVWRYGRSKEPAEIIADACGEPFNVRHYANYLTHKFAPLYGLK